MAGLTFEWDDRKARQNRRKHGVSFEEAQTVFFDEQALVIEDPDAGAQEDRFILLGMSALARTLVVVHCHRQASDRIRIVSARKANRAERNQYAGRVTR